MTTDTVSTRRRFFWKAGAALSAPLAVNAAETSAAPAEDIGKLKSRLRDQDAINGIHALQRRLARHINAGAIDQAGGLFVDPADAAVLSGLSHLAPVDFGDNDVIELASNCKTASAESHCVVDTETAIPVDCTLADMAHQQGDGVLRRTNDRILRADLVQQRGEWKIRRLTLT
jgi:hypothetical protein